VWQLDWEGFDLTDGASDNLDALRAQARALTEADEPELAADVWRRVLAQSPGDPEATAALGTSGESDAKRQPKSPWDLFPSHSKKTTLPPGGFMATARPANLNPFGAPPGAKPKPPTTAPAASASSLGAPRAPAASAPPETPPRAPVVISGTAWDAERSLSGVVNLDTEERPETDLERALRMASSGAQLLNPQIDDGEPLKNLKADDGEEESLDEAGLNQLMEEAEKHFDLGDFSGSLRKVQRVLENEPTHEGARAYLLRNQSTLIKMFESKLGDMYAIPKLLIPQEEVIWMNIHHRAAFLLSQIDGALSFEDLITISGMPRLEGLRILADLVGDKVIGVA
jgi:hypothetical protein